MTRLVRAVSAAILLLPSIASSAFAQSFDTVGTRAQGMSGAFVAVADDASATYWNPGALAKGAYFSLVLDGSSGEASTDGGAAGSRSGWLLSLAAPVVGLSYYRVRATTALPVEGPSPTDGGPDDRLLQLRSLVTHHAGATLVQSIFEGVSVGATLKLVRGIAAGGRVFGDAEELVDEGEGLIGEASNSFDLDVGILASTGLLRAGLTVRNVTEPEFDSPNELSLKLDRQVRAGISLLLMEGWQLSADLDLTRTPGPVGDPVRDLAFGGEARVARRGFARAGVRLNTAGGDKIPSFSVGGTYAVRASVLVDAQLTVGDDAAARGWGLAGRVVF